MKFLCDSMEAGHLSSREIGGKAYQLGQLTRLSAKPDSIFEVPAWCVLPAEALWQRVDHRDQNGSLKLSSSDQNEIRGWLKRFPQSTRFIVRSSMIGEDGIHASFAGQLESYPNLKSDESVFKAIEKCVKSARAERVLAYRTHHASDHPAESRVAVILQVMIDADRSGVLFTADPKDGCRRRFLVSSTFGACEAVVGGHFDCDEFEIENESIRSKIALKTSALRFDGEGLIARDLPDSDRSRPSLTAADLKTLKKIGQTLTTWRGIPLDIEWVMVESKIFVVQMRPITSLGADRSEQKKFVFDNSNIQESFNGLTLPLTFTYASEAYFKVYRQMLEMMGFKPDEVTRHDRRHQQMLALVQGRVYYNINSWYEGLLLLPSFGRNKEDMEKMMGVEEPVNFVVDQKLNGKEKLKRLPAALKMIVRLSIEFARIDRHVKTFRENFANAQASFPRSELKWMSPQEVFQLHDDLKNRILSNWQAPILNDFYVMMMSGKVRRTLARVNLEALMADLLAGEDLESTRPTKTLVAISDLIKREPLLLEALEEEADFFIRLAQYPEIERQIDSYIENYGDRVIGELKLETETLRQNRQFLVRILRSYALDPSLHLDGFEERQHAVRTRAEEQVFAAIRNQIGLRALRSFKSHLGKFRKAVAYREAMRLDRTRSFGIFRSIYLDLGQKLFDQGDLDHPRDIFYLKADEVDDFYHAKALFDEPRGLVELRKKQYDAWSAKRPAPHIETSVPLRELRPRTVESSANGLKGLGCYPGIIEAEVVVVDDPMNAPDLNGKIMIAERTDPGWTPLFLQIKGLIVERGSQLSHSAVVARELGLPSVVGVRDICRILKTGDRVRLNGQTGVVELLSLEVKDDRTGTQPETRSDEKDSFSAASGAERTI